jgi:hypothetical protein
MGRVYRNVRSYDAGVPFEPVRLSWPDQETVPRVPGTGSERFNEPARRAAETFGDPRAMTTYRSPGTERMAERGSHGVENESEPSEEELRSSIAQLGTMETGAASIRRMRDSLPSSVSFEELLRGSEETWRQHRNLSNDHRRLLRAVKDGLGLAIETAGLPRDQAGKRATVSGRAAPRVCGVSASGIVPGNSGA